MGGSNWRVSCKEGLTEVEREEEEDRRGFRLQHSFPPGGWRGSRAHVFSLLQASPALVRPLGLHDQWRAASGKQRQDSHGLKARAAVFKPSWSPWCRGVVVVQFYSYCDFSVKTKSVVAHERREGKTKIAEKMRLKATLIQFSLESNSVQTIDAYVGLGCLSPGPALRSTGSATLCQPGQRESFITLKAHVIQFLHNPPSFRLQDRDIQTLSIYQKALHLTLKMGAGGWSFGEKQESQISYAPSFY